MKIVADALGVSRSTLVERLQGGAKPRGRYRKEHDGALVKHVRPLVDARPTYGHRRITAPPTREPAAAGESPADHERVCQLMRMHGLSLQRHSGDRPGRIHDGKVVVIRSDLRWGSDGFEISCWNGEVVRGAARPLLSNQWRTRSR